MTPNARYAAAIAVLDEILMANAPAEQALLRWSRGARYAGSGDRAAVRDLVFDALRRRGSLARIGGAATGRGLMLGALRLAGGDPAQVFTGARHEPAALTESEAAPSPPDAGADDPMIDIPEWLWPRWHASLGDAAPAVADAMRQRAPVWLRHNPLRGSRADALALLAADGIIAQADPVLPGALRVTSGERRISGSHAYRQGRVELQDRSPQMACALLAVGAEDSVLDYCAGGGGKALALASAGAGSIVAHDADPARMRDLPARADRAGARISIARHPQGQFDLVVTDVPCSGSGTWRRTPDAKWRLTEAALQAVVTTQAQILDRAAGYVAPSGRLAYMTCSMLEDENHRQVEAFLARHPDFALGAHHRMLPPDDGDGFYCAILQRTAPKSAGL